MLDNILLGNLIEGLTPIDLGVTPDEQTITFTKTETAQLNNFLPRILVKAGLFKSTSEIKRIHKVRQNSTKIKDIDERILWRTLDKPELTYFKIGKKVFWLIVGTI